MMFFLYFDNHEDAVFWSYKLCDASTIALWIFTTHEEHNHKVQVTHDYSDDELYRQRVYYGTDPACRTNNFGTE
jgi:hypothetical protein